MHDEGFTGSLSASFQSMTPLDQMIEITTNQSYKEIGSLSGTTENVSVSERWEKFHYHMVAMREHLNEKVQRTQNMPILDLMH